MHVYRALPSGLGEQPSAPVYLSLQPAVCSFHLALPGSPTQTNEVFVVGRAEAMARFMSQGDIC